MAHFDHPHNLQTRGKLVADAPSMIVTNRACDRDQFGCTLPANAFCTTDLDDQCHALDLWRALLSRLGGWRVGIKGGMTVQREKPRTSRLDT